MKKVEKDLNGLGVKGPLIVGLFGRRRALSLFNFIDNVLVNCIELLRI